MTAHALIDLTESPREPCSGAAFSACGSYRYSLWRIWDASLPLAGVLGVNPSKAGVEDEDHTTRKLRGFGERLGWGGYLLCNPFGLVSTDQRGLVGALDPIGPSNDLYIEAMLALCPLTLCAWGSAKTAAVRKLLDARLTQLARLLSARPLMCLGRSKDGSPRHPLMLAYSTPLEPWGLS